MSSGPVLPATLARVIVDTCGPGRTLHLGCGDGALVGELLACGCDAHGVASTAAAAAEAARRWPGRFAAGSLASPGHAGRVVTVVVGDWLDAIACEAVPTALANLRLTGARHVFLSVSTAPFVGPGGRGEARTRAWWEARCFAAGFRKHAAYYRVNPYTSLNADGATVLVPLERVPDAALARFPLAALERERLLHMDMLRETGRRGDAHCIRYHMAAEQIRPGDTVLDLACGYGYGSHLLYHNSAARSVLGIDLSQTSIDYANANYGLPGAVRFECGDAQRLAVVADHSIDFVASFETIEHLPDPDAYLDELKRVLRPAGRIMVCAPNDWSDETGKDPNPHHLHVYTWDRLRREIGSRFLLEKGFVQTAGGAMKCHHSPRAFVEVPLAPLAREAEWILLLAMADPRAGAAVPYRETCWDLPNDPQFHVSSFARDYRNPWLVKGMVTIGMRHRLPAVLDELQASVLRDAEAGPVDRGAALCGRAYAALARPTPTAAEAIELERAIREHVAGSPGGPHQLRWQISLLFVGGELARRRGDFAAARSMYERCTQLDPMPYSPLLGNKTLDAWFRLAMLAVGEHDLAQARQCLVRSVDEARRLCTGPWLNVCGDPAKPLAFGFAELAQLLDKAGRAAYALAVLDSAIDRPAVFAAEAKGYFERILGHKDDDLTAITKENRQLYEELARSNRHAEQLAAIGDEKERHIRELDAALAMRPAGVGAAVRALLGRLADRVWRRLAPGRGRRP